VYRFTEIKKNKTPEETCCLFHNKQFTANLHIHRGVGVVICLQPGADCLQMAQLMSLHPQTPSSLASLKSRLVLPFLLAAYAAYPGKEAVKRPRRGQPSDRGRLKNRTYYSSLGRQKEQIYD